MKQTKQEMAEEYLYKFSLVLPSVQYLNSSLLALVSSSWIFLAVAIKARDIGEEYATIFKNTQQELEEAYKAPSLTKSDNSFPEEILAPVLLRIRSKYLSIRCETLIPAAKICQRKYR